MILRFPYLLEPIQGLLPPSLPPGTAARWRPLVLVTLHGFSPASFISFGRALVDSGADDTIFPLDVANLLGISLLPVTGHAMRWRGQRVLLRFGRVELQLTDQAGASLRWAATVAFSAANMRYPLLGMAGCLEFFDAKFFGRNRLLELESYASHAATRQP